MLRPVILDMDPGVDDALGLIFALRSPEVELVGISIVSGNVPLAQGVENALKVLDLMGRPDIPVFIGADRPLKRSPIHAFEVHGESGLGQALLPDPEQVPQNGAVNFIVESILARPGGVTLVATGPLTNLAMAKAQRPGILNQARRILVMGGAINTPGNVTSTSEFNFYADPHAARMVLHTGANLTLVPLDLTRQAWLEREQIAALAAAKDDPVNAFCLAASHNVCAFNKEHNDIDAIYLHDPLAIGLAIFPELGHCEVLCVDIDIEGESTAGQVKRIQPSASKDKGEGFDVECVMEMDAKAFLNEFVGRVFH
jgi:purine nucleosidase